MAAFQHRLNNTLLAPPEHHSYELIVYVLALNVHIYCMLYFLVPNVNTICTNCTLYVLAQCHF